jgi:hypothetical protein
MSVSGRRGRHLTTATWTAAGHQSRDLLQRRFIDVLASSKQFDSPLPGGRDVHPIGQM